MFRNRDIFNNDNDNDNERESKRIKIEPYEITTDNFDTDKNLDWNDLVDNFLSEYNKASRVNLDYIKELAKTVEINLLVIKNVFSKDSDVKDSLDIIQNVEECNFSSPFNFMTPLDFFDYTSTSKDTNDISALLEFYSKKEDIFEYLSRYKNYKNIEDVISCVEDFRAMPANLQSNKTVAQSCILKIPECLVYIENKNVIFDKEFLESCLSKDRFGTIIDCFKYIPFDIIQKKFFKSIANKLSHSFKEYKICFDTLVELDTFSLLEVFEDKSFIEGQSPLNINGEDLLFDKQAVEYMHNFLKFNIEMNVSKFDFINKSHNSNNGFFPSLICLPNIYENFNCLLKYNIARRLLSYVENVESGEHQEKAEKMFLNFLKNEIKSYKSKIPQYIFYVFRNDFSIMIRYKVWEFDDTFTFLKKNPFSLPEKERIEYFKHIDTDYYDGKDKLRNYLYKYPTLVQYKASDLNVQKDVLSVAYAVSIMPALIRNLHIKMITMPDFLALVISKNTDIVRLFLKPYIDSFYIPRTRPIDYKENLINIIESCKGDEKLAKLTYKIDDTIVAKYFNYEVNDRIVSHDSIKNFCRVLLNSHRLAEKDSENKGLQYKGLFKLAEDEINIILSFLSYSDDSTARIAEKETIISNEKSSGTLLKYFKEKGQKIDESSKDVKSNKAKKKKPKTSKLSNK